MRLVWSGGRGRGGRELGMFESPELAWLAGGVCTGKEKAALDHVGVPDIADGNILWIVLVARVRERETEQILQSR